MLVAFVSFCAFLLVLGWSRRADLGASALPAIAARDAAREAHLHSLLNAGAAVGAAKYRKIQQNNTAK